MLTGLIIVSTNLNVHSYPLSRKLLTSNVEYGMEVTFRMLQLKDFCLPVINLSTNELESLPLSDTEQITKDSKNNTIFHRNGIEYMLLTSLDDFNEYMFKLGLKQTDQSNVINIYKVDYFDDNLKNAYFDKEKKRFASVSAIHSKYIKHTVQGIKENKRLDQLDAQYLDMETTTDKKFKKFLDFFARKVHNT